jgi:hypothetical protein
MKEQFCLARCWDTLHSPPQEQVYAQNRADEEFDWHCEQAKLLELAVSPIKRSMRIAKDEDEGFPGMARYYLRVIVEGTEQEMQHLKDIFDKKYPPVYAEVLPYARRTV